MAAAVTEQDQMKQVRHFSDDQFLFSMYTVLPIGKCLSPLCHSCLLFFQFREFLGTYNRLTENCFMDCVKDFTTREVKPEEVGSLVLNHIALPSKVLGG